MAQDQQQVTAMPTRLIREGIISSDRIEQLDWSGEVFYRRLLNKVDDHGLYDARPGFLRTQLYPMRVDRVREADTSRWLAMCERAGLILLYEAGGKPFLQVLDTGWEKRSKPKFPFPNGNSCKQPETLAPVVVVEGVVVDEVKTLSGKPDVARRVLSFLNDKTGRHYKPLKANLDLIVARLNEGATEMELRQVIAKKCREWQGDEKMAMFIRPKTLFGRTNFAQYQGELLAQPELKNGMP